MQTVGSIGVASYGALGHVPLLNFQLFNFFWSLQSRTNSDIGLYVVSYGKNIIQAYTALSLFVA